MAERLNHNVPQCRDIWQIGGYNRLACICFYSSCYWVAYEVERLFQFIFKVFEFTWRPKKGETKKPKRPQTTKIHILRRERI